MVFSFFFLVVLYVLLIRKKTMFVNSKVEFMIIKV